MGWAKHVEFIETECLDCGEIDDWEYWSDIGRARYADLGEALGIDVTKHGKCPHCGSINGHIVEDEDDAHEFEGDELMGNWRDRRQFYILDADHRVVPANLDTWGAMIEDGRLVDYTEITSAVRVSTVFVGIDLAPWDDGPPKVFETMVFRNGNGEDCWRYSSWDDAVIGHKAVVKKLRGKQHVR